MFQYVSHNMKSVFEIPGPPKSAEVSAFLAKAAFLLFAAFFSFPGSVFFQNQVLCKAGSRKSAELGGTSAEFSGTSAEFRGIVAFRLVFSARAAFLGFLGGLFLPGPFGRKFRRVQVCQDMP